MNLPSCIKKVEVKIPQKVENAETTENTAEASSSKCLDEKETLESKDQEVSSASSVTENSSTSNQPTQKVIDDARICKIC